MHQRSNLYSVSRKNKRELYSKSERKHNLGNLYQADSKVPNLIKIHLSTERKTKMLKYTNIATVGISIGLHNDYSVLAFANWSKENNCYEVTLYIKRNDIDLLELIEKQENVLFVDSDAKSIRTDIADYVTTLLSQDFFTYYISRYEYEQNCFDKGNEFYEMESSYVSE